jgi:hypothetical protein
LQQGVREVRKERWNGGRYMGDSIMMVLFAEPVTPSGIRPCDDEEKYAAEDDSNVPHNISLFHFEYFLFGSRWSSGAN